MAKKADQYGPGTALVVFLVSKVGMRDAIKVATFIVQWGMVMRELGREPTWSEYCEYWGDSRATYHRALKLHRQVWPEDKTPGRVWLWLESAVPKGSSEEEAVSAVLLAGAP